MKKNITQAEIAKLKKLKPGEYTVFDTSERGLALRVKPSGVMAWRVRLKTKGGEWYWWPLGGLDALKPEKARVQAHRAKGRAAEGIDLREDRAAAVREVAQRMSLRTFIEDVYAPLVRGRTKSGDGTIKMITGRFADFLDRPLADIEVFAIERWRSAYLKQGRSPATANRLLAALKACLAEAVRLGKLKAHPLKGLRLARLDSIGRLRYLSPDEETRLLAALAARDGDRREARVSANDFRRQRGYELWPEYPTYTDVLTPMVITLLHTGLRFGEACGLTWADVDLVGALLTVRGETSKSSKTRYVPLNKTVLDVLKTWKPKKVDAGAYVFAGADGARLVDIKTAWKNLLKSITDKPIVGFRVHDLRHTFASKLVQAGVDLNTVRELLGHGDIKMTLRYAHLAPEHRAAAVAKLVAVAG